MRIPLVGFILVSIVPRRKTWDFIYTARGYYRSSVVGFKNKLAWVKLSGLNSAMVGRDHDSTTPLLFVFDLLMIRRLSPRLSPRLILRLIQIHRLAADHTYRVVYGP